MVKRRSGCLLGNEGKRQEGLLVERETTSEGVFISTDFNLSFIFTSLRCFFKKKQKNFPVHTTSLLPRLVSSGWVFNSFSLMSPSFDVTHRMHRGTWEVLTSAHNSNNICRQDKQQNQRRNSPSTTSTIPLPPAAPFFFFSSFLHHLYFITEPPLRRCLISSAAWSTATRWELTIDDPRHLNDGACNTWLRSIMNKRQSEIRWIIVLILRGAEGKISGVIWSDVSFTSVYI